jgi:hypothetical protein
MWLGFETMNHDAKLGDTDLGTELDVTYHGAELLSYTPRRICLPAPSSSLSRGLPPPRPALPRLRAVPPHLRPAPPPSGPALPRLRPLRTPSDPRRPRHQHTARARAPPPRQHRRHRLEPSLPGAPAGRPATGPTPPAAR